MSDSGKLRLVYGLLFFALSLLSFTTFTSLILLLIFNVLSSVPGYLMFVLLCFSAIGISGTTISFKIIYDVGKKDGKNE